MSETAIDYKANNKAVIFDALVVQGIEKLIVQYSGSGDSGAIDGIFLDDGNCTEPNLDMAVKWVRTQSTWENINGEFVESVAGENTESAIRDAIEAFCYEALYDHHAGWENNDGGDGEFVFDVTDRTVNLTHNEFYTESNTFEHHL